MALGWEYLDADGQLALFERAAGAFSRRQLLRRGAVALGGLAGAGLLDPNAVLAGVNAAPRPIPGGFDQNFKPVPKHPFIHVLSPGIGSEMSTITDFKGVVAGSEIRGKAHGSDGTIYDFDTDMRFMHGVYVGLDGRMRQGAFGFV
jgi:hypothetical protein